MACCPGTPRSLSHSMRRWTPARFTSCMADCTLTETHMVHVAPPISKAKKEYLKATSLDKKRHAQLQLFHRICVREQASHRICMAFIHRVRARSQKHGSRSNDGNDHKSTINIGALVCVSVCRIHKTKNKKQKNTKTQKPKHRRPKRKRSFKTAYNTVQSFIITMIISSLQCNAICRCGCVHVHTYLYGNHGNYLRYFLLFVVVNVPLCPDYNVCDREKSINLEMNRSLLLRVSWIFDIFLSRSAYLLNAKSCSGRLCSLLRCQLWWTNGWFWMWNACIRAI